MTQDLSPMAIKAIDNNQVNELKRLLSHMTREQIQRGDSKLFRFAASVGKLDCVKALLPLSDPKALNSYALRKATFNGYEEVALYLLPHSGFDIQIVMDVLDSAAELNLLDLTDNILKRHRALHPQFYAKNTPRAFLADTPILLAIRKEHLGMVRRLMPYTQLSSQVLEEVVRRNNLNLLKELIPTCPLGNGKALVLAARFGKMEMVELLTPLFNPKQNNSEFLWQAALGRRRDVVDFLLPLSDPSMWSDGQWEELQEDSKGNDDAMATYALLQKVALTRQLPEATLPTAIKSTRL